MYRPIPKIPLGKIKPKIQGKPGSVVDCPISALLIDGRYQRVFTPRNEDRVRALVQTWDWSLYTPIIIADVPDGYAVIDGQHRAAAALAIGIPDLPAWLTVADPVAQAKAFLAINAQTTRVDPMQLWHSRLAGNDPAVAHIFNLCEDAGIEIARYPIAQSIRKPNVTLCPAEILASQRAYGDEITVRALRVGSAIGKKQKTSLLTRPVIRALSRLFATVWDEVDDDVAIQALEGIDFARTLSEAGVASRRGEGTISECFCHGLMTALSKMLEAA